MSSSRVARASASCLIALALLAFAPARASGTTTYAAPFDCGSDEIARRVGVLQTFAPIPAIPTQTHGCDWSTPLAPVIWSWYVPTTNGTLDVVATVTGDPVCVFVSPGPACAAHVRAPVIAGARYAIGATTLGGSKIAVVQRIDATLS